MIEDPSLFRIHCDTSEKEEIVSRFSDFFRDNNIEETNLESMKVWRIIDDYVLVVN